MDWKDQLSSIANKIDIKASEIENKADETETAATHPGKINIYYERKGRGGKEVTILADTSLSDERLEKLASEIKKKLGTGGSCRGGEILIQGDRRKAIADFLREKGFKTNI